MTVGTSPIEIACEHVAAGQTVAIATVVDTWGSAPVPVGGQLVVLNETTFFGSVSGGCVENDVILQAMDVIESGRPQLLDYGIEDDTAWSVGLPCGGRIQVFVERFSPLSDADLLASMQLAISNRMPFCWKTNVETGNRTHDGSLDSVVSSSSTIDSGVFEHTVQPPPRLVIVGAVHVAQVLNDLVAATGFDAVIVDPREAYANDARFSNAQLIREWPIEALEQIGLDHFTAIAALAHVPDIDDPALKAAVQSPAFYIGALGSTRNHAKRRERLLAAGMSPEQFARIRCPIGLDIGAVNPAEIALSVMAEFVLALRGQKRVAKAA